MQLFILFSVLALSSGEAFASKGHPRSIIERQTTRHDVVQRASKRNGALRPRQSITCPTGYSPVENQCCYDLSCGGTCCDGNPYNSDTECCANPSVVTDNASECCSPDRVDGDHCCSVDLVNGKCPAGMKKRDEIPLYNHDFHPMQQHLVKYTMLPLGPSKKLTLSPEAVTEYLLRDGRFTVGSEQFEDPHYRDENGIKQRLLMKGFGAAIPFMKLGYLRDVFKARMNMPEFISLSPTYQMLAADAYETHALLFSDPDFDGFERSGLRFDPETLSAMMDYLPSFNRTRHDERVLEIRAARKL